MSDISIMRHGTLADGTEFEVRTRLDENDEVLVYEFSFSRAASVARYRVAAAFMEAAHFYWNTGTIARFIIPACTWHAREAQPTRTR